MRRLFPWDLWGARLFKFLLWWWGLVLLIFILFIVGNFQLFQDATLIWLLNGGGWGAAVGLCLTTVLIVGSWRRPKPRPRFLRWRYLIFFGSTFLFFLLLAKVVVLLSLGFH